MAHAPSAGARQIARIWSGDGPEPSPSSRIATRVDGPPSSTRNDATRGPVTSISSRPGSSSSVKSRGAPGDSPSVQSALQFTGEAARSIRVGPSSQSRGLPSCRASSVGSRSRRSIRPRAASNLQHTRSGAAPGSGPIRGPAFASGTSPAGRSRTREATSISGKDRANARPSEPGLARVCHSGSTLRGPSGSTLSPSRPSAVARSRSEPAPWPVKAGDQGSRTSRPDPAETSTTSSECPESVPASHRAECRARRILGPAGVGGARGRPGAAPRSGREAGPEGPTPAGTTPRPCPTAPGP